MKRLNVLLSMSVFAAMSAAVQATEVPCSGNPCHEPPKPVSFELIYGPADRLYRSAGPITDEDLTGRWMHVGVINHPENRKNHHTLLEDQVNSNGVEYDGKVMFLEFKRGVTQGRWSTEGPYAVLRSSRSNGETSHYQGPFEVRFDGSTACFSLFDYTRRGQSNQFYYALECRMSVRTDLICSLTPEGERAKASDEEYAWYGKSVGYYVFRKVR